MQERKYQDPDGVAREYAYDDFDASLYIRTTQSSAANPGRPYYLVTRIDSLRSRVAPDAGGVVNVARYAGIHSLDAAHAALWADAVEAKDLLSRPMPPVGYGWRSAH